MYTHYIMKYYPSVRKKATLPFVTTRMNLEAARPSEISQTEKDKHCMGIT